MKDADAKRIAQGPQTGDRRARSQRKSRSNKSGKQKLVSRNAASKSVNLAELHVTIRRCPLWFA